MRISFQTWKKGRMEKDLLIEDFEEDSRTHKILNALEKVCMSLDLSVPIWLDGNVRDFKRRSRTRFTRDSFMEDIPFDYLEIRVIEED